MRALVLMGLVAAVQAGVALPLTGQQGDPDAGTWQLEGLRTSFCVQLLLDPASAALQDLPPGFRPVPASEVRDLPVSLRGVVEGQPEFASWSPSRVCVHTVDTIRTKEFALADRSGRHPQLFATWTVEAADPGGVIREVALDLFANSGRLIRAARLAGQVVREARLTIGKVPAEDENGVPSSDDRFQVKVGKTTVTWDGRLAGDSVPVPQPVLLAWAVTAVRGQAAEGRISLTPIYARSMVGSLKVDGKDALAKALRASPTRFAGPAYGGGAGSITFTR